MNTEDGLGEGLRTAWGDEHEDVDGALSKVKGEGRARKRRRQRRIATAGALGAVALVLGSYGFGSVAPRPVVVTELANQLGVPVAENTTTTTAAAPATTTAPPSTTAAAAPIVLRPDGLGVVKFGDGADKVVATLTARLGKPSSDSGWIDIRNTPSNDSPWDGCTSDLSERASYQRKVEWGPLTVGFANRPDASASPSSATFVNWTYGAAAARGGTRLVSSA